MGKLGRGGRPKRAHETIEAARAEAQRLYGLERGHKRAHVFQSLETIEPDPQTSRLKSKPAAPTVEIKRKRRLESPSAAANEENARGPDARAGQPVGVEQRPEPGQ